MHLIDEPRARELYAAMGPGIEISGGSAANTIVGIASFGGRAQYIGKVKDDQLGDVFNHDLRSTGVVFETSPAVDGPPTGRSLILVTPDAQRTMNTFLGASVHLGPGDIDAELIGRGRILFLEGYLFDPPAAREAFRVAARMAHAAGRKVSLTICDPFCVDRHRDEFRDLVEHHVDILFANEAEICSLYGVNQLQEAAERVRGEVRLAALTCSADGSMLVTASGTERVAAAPVARVVDTTGAGDLYAAGLLYGLARSLPPPACGRLGSLAAAEVLGQYGARAKRPLKPLVGAAGA
jgi:sugar/nucleoside kinase (ribokinase family)